MYIYVWVHEILITIKYTKRFFLQVHVPPMSAHLHGLEVFSLCIPVHKIDLLIFEQVYNTSSAVCSGVQLYSCGVAVVEQSVMSWMNLLTHAHIVPYTTICKCIIPLPYMPTSLHYSQLHVWSEGMLGKEECCADVPHPHEHLQYS